MAASRSKIFEQENTAEHKGFARQAFDEHEGFSTAIAVGSNLISENLIFRLRPDAVISGTIFDEQNEPVRGAQVMLFRRQLIMAIKGPTCRHRREAMIWVVTYSADCVRELILWSCP